MSIQDYGMLRRRLERACIDHWQQGDQLILACYVYGLERTEIAQAVNLSLRTVDRRLKRLKEEIFGDHDIPGNDRMLGMWWHLQEKCCTVLGHKLARERHMLA